MRIDRSAESLAHAQRYFAESIIIIIIIIIRIDQNLQDSLDAASTAGDAPKLRQTRYSPQAQKCSVLHTLFAWDSICNAVLSTIKQHRASCVREKSSSPQLQLRKIALMIGGVPNTMMADHLTVVLQAFTFMAAGPHRRSQLQLHRLP